MRITRYQVQLKHHSMIGENHRGIDNNGHSSTSSLSRFYNDNVDISCNDKSNTIYPISGGLCNDCDALKYCQLARNLSSNHLASQKVIYGHLGTPTKRNLSTNLASNLPDQHILAEKFKLRYKTCPFHRELSLGLGRP